MKKQFLNPHGVFKHPGFTRVVTAEGAMKWVFIAGQTPSDQNYRCVSPGDLRAQYIHVMNQLKLQLEAAGATFADVVYRRTFVLDVDAYMKIARDPATPKYFNAERMPGSTMVGVTRLSDPEFLIEVDLLAVVQA